MKSKNIKRTSSNKLLAVILFLLFVVGFVILAHREGQEISFGPGVVERVIDLDNGWTEYYDEEFNVSFEHPELVSPQVTYAGERPINDTRYLELYSKDYSLQIEQTNVMEDLSVERWLELQDGRYSDLMQIIGEADIDGDRALVMGQPKTCQTAGMLVAIVEGGNTITLISHIELTENKTAPEFKRILETLSFDKTSSKREIPEEMGRFPNEPHSINCP